MIQNLHIIADDLGLHKSVNDGIIFLLKEGKIDGASLMANGRHFEDAVQKIRSLPESNGKVGIHLVLVAERAVLPHDQIPSLVDINGNLNLGHKIFFIKYLLGKINLGDIEKELKAQLDRIIQAGIRPAFLNSHQHLHLLPAIGDIIIRLAKEYQINYIRLVKEPFWGSGGLFRKAELVFLRILSVWLGAKIRKNGLQCNDFSIGFLNAGNINRDDLKEARDLSKKNPDKSIELNCHPGFENEELSRVYKKWRYNWRSELEVLKEGLLYKIFYCSLTRTDYSLNSVLINGLRGNGVEVTEFYLKNKSTPNLIKAVNLYRHNSKDADAVLVGYNSQILVPILKPFCRTKIIYNAVLSEYERMIVSRNLAPRFSIKAFYYWFIDFIAVHLADLIMIESGRQLDFFSKIFKVSRKKLYKRWIGVDENNFFYDSSIPKFEVFTVFFRGALMPEAGAEYLIQAAKILEGENIRFIMLSGGLLLDKIKKLIEELKPKNLEFRSDLLPVEELRTLMQKSHLSIGQLSDHPRLKRTIPHKLYESLAMCLPYLTASNTGILELVTAGETCITCRPADARSVAEKILWARNNPKELEKIAQNGYQLYQDKLRSDILAKNLLDKIGKL